MGGLEKAQVTLANSLQRAGYSVTVMILDEGRDLEDELDEGVTLFRKVYKHHLGKSIPYIRHKFYDDGMWEKRAKPAELYKYYVGDEKYDVEIAFFHGLPAKIISGSTNKNAVHIAWIHNDLTKVHSHLFNFRDHAAVFRAYTAFDHVVCVSEAARQGFITAVGDTGNTVTIYNMLPVDEIRRLAGEEIPYKYPEKGLNLVHVGRLKDSHKGQRRLIDVISRLHREGCDISLTLVGDGSDRAAIEHAIVHHNAEQYIFTVGSQKNPFPYIAGADMLVCASYYEGFNLTVAEALILGVPVVSTSCTGPCEILDNGRYGMIVENSEVGLYDGIKEFYRSPILQKLYKSRAEQRIDFFSEERIMKKITDLIERK